MSFFERTLPHYEIESADLITAYKRLIHYCLENRCHVPFGDAKNPKVMECEISSQTILSGKAVKQLLDGVNYLSQFSFIPLKRNSIQGYIDEYSMEFIEKQRLLDEKDPRKFAYLYYDRLKFGEGPDGKTYDQVEAVKNDLARQIKEDRPSNRNQMITWNVSRDLFSDSPPCLQRVWVAYLGDHKIGISLDWRSRDLYGAWLANLVALTNMFERDIARPNNCEIVWLKDKCDSLHIMEGDYKEALKTV